MGSRILKPRIGPIVVSGYLTPNVPPQHSPASIERSMEVNLK